MRLSSPNRDLTWHQDRSAVAAILRTMYSEEFQALQIAECANAPGKTVKQRNAVAYSRARTKLMRNHRDEYLALLKAKRAARGRPYQGWGQARLAKPRPTPRPKQPVNLTKKPKPARTEIDPDDCRILFERGMSVPEIARHDGCSRAAVLRVLVPMLYRRRSHNAAWWESERQMSTYDLSQILDVPGIELGKYVPAEDA